MILLPKQPKVTQTAENRASFEIEDLHPGYGVTIGNSLRRVLLSSLTGAAITQVKIKGVQHEFSTMKGVMEDVIVMIMNLKQMRFKVFSDEPQKGTLKIKEEKEIKGSDFKFPTQVELVNKKCHIATITDKNIELEMEIQIEKGIGYEPVERRKKREKLEIGVTPIDSIFTPVKRVSFKVENMRVGERTDFDRLNIDIETDGTITPEQAFSQSSGILVKHFSLLEDSFKAEEKEVKEEKPAKKEENKGEEDKSKTKIEDMGLSSRTLTSLISGGIKSATGLSKKTEKALMELEGMREASIKEIKKSLKKLELELKE